MIPETCAPKARRTPSSCDRLDTVKLSSPWMPNPAISSAIAERAASSQSCVLRDAVSSSRTSDIMRTSETGCSASAALTISRIRGNSRPTPRGVAVRTTRSLGLYPTSESSGTCW